jgi:2-amino-4-hydroxy-6-hydroxymethyldihydropteridine diphosphokinase
VKDAALTEVGIGLGSNIGDKAGHIARAVELLKQSGALERIKMSSLYRTPPWGVTEQDWFVNACLAGETRLAPLDLLAKMQQIELAMGRKRIVHWGPRVIDLDILYYGTVSMHGETLTLPHPEIVNRGFVLVPLAEIRPQRLIGGVTARELALKFAGEGIVKM